jgi:uncharacterized protein involved in response to NO
MKTLHLIQVSSAGVDAPWAERWRHFISMPHQAMFTLGALQAVLVMLWWLVDLGSRYGGWGAPLNWAIPAPWAHAYLMIFGLFPPYMFGFLMTTYPRWMAGMPVSPKHYLPAAALLACGILLSYVGLSAGKLWLMTALIVYLAGWALCLYALLHVYVGAERPDTLHALITSGVLIIGFCLLLVYLFGIGLDNAFLISIARIGGIWWFLFPVFFAVSHRLIPFFSAAVIPHYNVIRPDWTLWVMTIGGMAHGALNQMQHSSWTWAIDLPMAAVAFWLSCQWSIRQTFKVSILAMLHLSFAWVGIALALFGLQSLAQFINAEFVLGRGPLHALTVGYFASMLVAMSTRVTLGHSGRPLAADQGAWAIFIAVQVTALVRVLADFPLIQAFAGHHYLCSALLWLAAFGGWLVKFTPVFWTKP